MITLNPMQMPLIQGAYSVRRRNKNAIQATWLASSRQVMTSRLNTARYSRLASRVILRKGNSFDLQG